MGKRGTQEGLVQGIQGRESEGDTRAGKRGGYKGGKVRGIQGRESEGHKAGLRGV